GAISSIVSGAWPVALPTQLRSQARISATVKSVWAGVLVTASSPVSGALPEAVSVMCHRDVSARSIGERIRGCRSGPQAAVDVVGAAGPAADLAAGCARDRARGHQQHVTDRHAVAHGDRGADVVGDRLGIELVGAGCSLTDDHQLLGGVIRVILQPRV